MFSKVLLNKVNITFGICVTWSTLGFYRGLQEYDYNNSKVINSTSDTYLYSNLIRINFEKIIHGFMGTFLYINPIFILITIPKEIYRLEVNIRGLENEKKTKYYKDIL